MYVDTPHNDDSRVQVTVPTAAIPTAGVPTRSDQIEMQELINPH